jgi:hypothetical protein
MYTRRELFSQAITGAAVLGIGGGCASLAIGQNGKRWDPTKIDSVWLDKAANHLKLNLDPAKINKHELQTIWLTLSQQLKDANYGDLIQQAFSATVLDFDRAALRLALAANIDPDSARQYIQRIWSLYQSQRLPRGFRFDLDAGFAMISETLRNLAAHDISSLMLPHTTAKNVAFVQGMPSLQPRAFADIACFYGPMVSWYATAVQLPFLFGVAVATIPIGVPVAFFALDTVLLLYCSN